MDPRATSARTVFAWVLVAVLTAIAWLLVRPFLSWLLATGLIAFGLAPVQRRLEDRIGARLSAGLLVGVVLVVVVGSFAVGLNVVLDDGLSLVEGISDTGVFRQIHRTIERTTGVSVPVEPLVQRWTDRATDYLRDRATSFFRAGLHAFVGFLLAAFVLYYLLKDGDRFVGWLRRVTPLPADVRDELFESADGMVWAVIEGHVLVAVVQGAVAGVGLFLTGVPHALTLTVAMMFLAIVPIVGVSPVLGGAVAFLFLRGDVLSAAFVVAWGFTVVAVTDDYLRALLIDRQSEMHSAVIFVGIAGGTYLLGAMGLFVGPILIGLLKATVEVLGDHYGVIHRPV